MKLTRFPRLGVAGWRVAVVVLVGGCSSLTSAPPASLDGGNDTAMLDSAGPAETGYGSDGLGSSRADRESSLVVDAQLAEAPAEVRDDAAMPAPGLDAAGDLGGQAGTGDGGGAVGVTGDASLAFPDANVLADGGGASQVDSLVVVDLAAGDDLVEFVADGPGEDAGIGGSAPVADATGEDAAVPSDLASVLFTVSAGADQSICAGRLATLGAQTGGGTPPYAYAWSASPACSDCISSATTAQTDVVPTATTTFTVTAQDSLAAVATDSVVIRVVDAIADAGPEATVDPGAPVRIGTPARSGYTYAWTCDRPTCALSSATAAQPAASPRLSTMYTVAVTSPEGCTASDSTTVWVNLPVSTTPADGEPAYPASASLLVQFGAAVQTKSISTDTVLLRETTSGTPVPFSYTPNPSLRTLTITPPTGANYNATLANYTLTLVGGASGIISNDALRPQRLPEDVVISFTLTAAPDTSAPTIFSRSPALSAMGVATNTSVLATFSETLDPATVTPANFAVSSASANVAGTLSYDATTSTITFVPAAPLTTSTTYTVGVTGIEDLSGNLAASSNWSFTTGRNSDATAPTVMAVSPASGATRASVSTSVVVTFSEPVDPTTLPAGVQVAAGTTLVAGGVTCDAANQVATFTPSALLASQTLYTVTVAGVKDLAGNTMTAAFTSTFTTARVLFSDSFESGTAQWTWPQNSAWGLTTAEYVSPTHSLTDSPGGNYAPSLDTSAISTAFDVTNLASVSVSYWLSGQTQPQPGADVLRVDYSINGGATWTNLANWSGTLAWAQHFHTATLTPGTTAMQIRFRLTTNGSQQFDGVYLDDVLVQAL
jgi:hypothetical protein